MRLRDILKAPNEFNPVLAEAINQYVFNPNSPRSGKLQALAKLDEVLGLPKPADPEFALNVYLAIPNADEVFVSDSTIAEEDDGKRFDPTDLNETGAITRDMLYAEPNEDEDPDEEDWD